MRIPKTIIALLFLVSISLIFLLIAKKDTFITELQNLSRNNYPPLINRSYPKYGHSEDFSWVAGKLTYNSLEGGCWTLHFEEDKSTQTEEYNGILSLKIANNLITQFKNNEFVVVYGKVIGQKFSMACPPNIYEVSDITAN